MPTPPLSDVDSIERIEILRDRLITAVSHAKDRLKEARAFVAAAQGRAQVSRGDAQRAAASYRKIVRDMGPQDSVRSAPNPG